MLREVVSALDDRLVKEWNGCTLCPIGMYASKHVHLDHVGHDNPYLQHLQRLPLLFVGEAPGESEDVIGKPFVGKAGKLLRASIDLLQETLSLQVPYSIANTVACRPCNGPNTKNRQPDLKETANCSPRLRDIMQSLNPVVLVGLGNVADTAIAKTIYVKSLPHSYFKLKHPAFICRSGGFGGEAHKEFMSELSEALKTAEEYVAECQ